MGTTCSLFGDGDLAEGERWVRSIAARITRFDESSELSRLNAAAAWVDISPELEQLLRASLLAFEMSGGLVNVGTGTCLESTGGRGSKPALRACTDSAVQRWTLP